MPLATGACLDPLLINEIDVVENHPPILKDVQPEPEHKPQLIRVGSNCGVDVSFRGRVEDLDADQLTVRWNLRIQLDGVQGGARYALEEKALVPLPERGPNGEQYELLLMELTLATLGKKIEEATLRRHDMEDYLLELRVSDGGFIPGQEVPESIFGFAFFSWAIRIDYVEDCSTAGT
jgi:hypothetical protein